MRVPVSIVVRMKSASNMIAKWYQYAMSVFMPGKPEKTRDDELPADVPTLVVNGDRDPFGIPSVPPGTDLVVLPGERHDLRKDTSAVAGAVLDWLRSRGWAA